MGYRQGLDGDSGFSESYPSAFNETPDFTPRFNISRETLNLENVGASACILAIHALHLAMHVCRSKYII